MDIQDLLDEELNLPSVFIDEGKLSSDYIPDTLLFRSEELKLLVRHFKSIFTSRYSTKKIILHGPVGSGKTSVAKKFGEWVGNKVKEMDVTIKYIHINCRRNRSTYMILLNIARQINSHVPSRGYSAQELLEMLIELLEAKSMKIIIVLDEIDYVEDEELSHLLYGLTRTSDDRNYSYHHIGLILISRNLLYLDKLDQSTKSTLMSGIHQFNPYSLDELEEILRERVKSAFIFGAITNESIKLAAEIAASRGDARLGLELLWYGGKFADKERTSIVYPDQIRQAKNSVEPSLIRPVLKYLDDPILYFLLAIIRRLKYSQRAFITTGSAKESYQIVCEEAKLKPRKHTQLWNYLKELAKLGIINCDLSGEGQRGNTQHISIHDVSLAKLEKEVLKRLPTNQTE